MTDSLTKDPGVRCVAIRMRISRVVLFMERPARHHNLMHELADWLGRPLKHSEYEQGFLANNGDFVDRHHAARLCGRTGQLFSEDLW